MPQVCTNCGRVGLERVIVGTIFKCGLPRVRVKEESTSIKQPSRERVSVLPPMLQDALKLFVLNV